MSKSENIDVLHTWHDIYRYGLSGGIGGALTEFLLYGLDSYKITQQAGATLNLYKILKGSVPISILGSGTNYGVFFAIYSPVKDYLRIKFGKDYESTTVLIASGVSAIPSSIMSVPADVLKKQLILRDNNSVMTAAKSVYREMGFKGFFVGWKANLIEDVPFACLELSIYEKLSEIYIRYLRKHMNTSKVHDNISSNKSQNILNEKESGAVGFCTGAITGILTNPIDCVNTRIKSGELIEFNVWDAHFEIIRRNGVRGLFRGLGPRMIIVGCGSTVFWYLYSSIQQFI